MADTGAAAGAIAGATDIVEVMAIAGATDIAEAMDIAEATPAQHTVAAVMLVIQSADTVAAAVVDFTVVVAAVVSTAVVVVVVSTAVVVDTVAADTANRSAS